MQQFDVVINGGGIVGLTLACGLEGDGLRVAVIERQEPEKIPHADRPALRVSAINVASQRLLQHIQVWNQITKERANPYSRIEVCEQDGFGHITFDGAKLGCPELGHIIENLVIQRILWQRATTLEKVTMLTSTSLCEVTWRENEVLLILDDGRILTTRLVVAADGAQSWLRTNADIPLTFWDYQQHALVAIVRTAQPHDNIARQTFHRDGILAFLPLHKPNLNSIVWSLPPAVARKYLTASAEAFNVALTTNFNVALGVCELYGERKTFPLTGRYARNFAAHRIVLVGDAAHTIHPLAGQGVNLGFMDVAVLLGEIRRLQKVGQDIGHYPNLRRYELNRKQSAALMLAGMQVFRELFAGQHPLKKWIREVGLRLADTFPGVKEYFIQQAIGLHDLPPWLAGEYFDEKI